MTMTYTWMNAEKTAIREVSDDGTTRFIPVDPANTDYAKIVAEAIEPEPYVPPPQPQEVP